MNPISKSIRKKLGEMAPEESAKYIQAFRLPDEEELVLIERESRGKSLQQIALKHNLSLGTVKRKRQRAFRKIHQAEKRG